MRAVIVRSPGGIEHLEITSIPEPDLLPGHVVVQVSHAACNWGDVQKRQGSYPDRVQYPIILGGEASGRIVAVGEGVRSIQVGQPVALLTGPDMLRGFAELVAVPANLVIPLPSDIDMRQAATFPVATLTAFHLLHTAHRIRRGETVLVHAVSGGVGLALTQLARDAGAHVFGTVGSADKVELPLSLGAELVVARDKEDFTEVIMRETAGRGVDLVIDSLGADILERSLDVLRPFGRLINIGEAAGEPEFAIRKALYRRSTSMAGFELLHAVPGSRRWKHGVRHIMRALAEKRLQLPIAAEFDMDQIRQAHALLESRRSMGKVVLKIGGNG